MFYFAYFGNKRREIPLIEKEITALIESGQIDKIVEPFCGSGALSFHLHKKYGDKLEYHLNDNDGRLIDFLTEIKKQGSCKSFFDYINEVCKDLTKERFADIVKKGKPDNLRDWVFSRKVYGSRHFQCPVINGPRKYGGYDYTKYEKLDSFVTSEKTHFTHGDYLQCFQKYRDDPKALIFVDPPYLDSFNSCYLSHSGISLSAEREIIDMTRVFIDIVELLQNRAKVVTIQNSNHLTRHLYRDFFQFEYAKNYSLTRKNTQHAIFANFPIEKISP